MMPFRFCPESDEESFLQIAIAPALSQKILHINLLIRKEAGSDLAVRSQAEAGCNRCRNGC